MRDLLYKNLSFPSRGRKVIASSEVADKEGVHSIIRRHFSYIVKPIQNGQVVKPQPYLYVLKQKNTKDKREHFFCKIKGSALAVNQGSFFQILFVHTLSINLSASADLGQPIS
jgi:hypothetical protein